MKTYHKIQTVFKRDQDNRFKPVLEGEYSLPEFEYLARNKWTFTEKVDGTNIRVMYRNGLITFGGKTDNASIPAPLANSLVGTFGPLTDKFNELFDSDTCLYGEGFGAGIQKGGGNYRPDQGFVLFDVQIGDWWLQRSDVEDIAHKLSLEVVPIVAAGTLDDMMQIVKGGFASVWGNFQAEGIVARPAIELKTHGGSRIITKLKCKDFA